MKKLISTIFSFSLLALILTVPADTGATGATVTGCCNSSGPIATPMDVSIAATEATAAVNAFTAAESELINANIYNAGQSITAEIQKSRTASSKLFENQNTALRELFIGFGAAQQEMKTQERSGKFARFNSLCVGPEVGAGIQVGKKAEKKLSKKLEDDTKEYNKFWKNPDDLRDHHAKKDPEKINADVLFPVNKTLVPEELKHAQNMVELIVNPYPELQIPEEVKGTDQAKLYELLQKQKKALLAIPQLVFNKSLAAVSPTLPLGNQATELHRQMGGTGTPEQVVDGKISPYAFLDLSADSRFASPNWYAEVATKDELALLRESLAMNAALLEIQNRKLELIQLQTLMAAQESAMKIQENMNPTLNDQFIKATKQ